MKAKKTIKAGAGRAPKKPLGVHYAELLLLRQIVKSQSSKPQRGAMVNEKTYARSGLQIDLPRSDRCRDYRLAMDARRRRCVGD
jgi:hypothetical protein